jgi:Helix-turn-helix domain
VRFVKQEYTMHALNDPQVDENEAADLIGFTPATLRTWRSRGRVATDGIPGPSFRKIGRRVVYPLSDLQAFVEAFPKLSFTASRGGASEPDRS